MAWAPKHAEASVHVADVADWRLPDAAFLAAFRLPPKGSGALAAVHPFPREHRVQFDVNTHTYMIDAVEAPRSVTKLLHAYVGEFNATRALGTMREGKGWEGKRADLEASGFGTSDEDFIERWRFEGEVARARGTLLHYQAEQAANGRRVEEPHSPEFAMVLQCFVVFAGKGWTPYRTEVNIFHCGLRCAGQPDLLCKDEDSRIVIVDWKRAKALPTDSVFGTLSYPLNHLPDAAYWHYAMQVNVYRFFLESEYNLAVGSMWLACVHPDACAPRLVQVPRMEAEVAALVEYEIAQGRATESAPDALFTLR